MNRDARGARGRDARDVLVVCGLSVEARIARGPGVRTIAGGGRSDALADTIAREVDRGVVAIASFGIAGALVPSLRPGSLIVADRIVHDDGRWPCDPRWVDALARRLPHVVVATIAGSDGMVVDRDEKERLRERLHERLRDGSPQSAIGSRDDEADVVAVDMESHVAARIAARHRLPFIALRAIADPFDRVVPPAARVAMRDGGGIDVAAVLRSIAASPRQLPALLAIAADTRTALRALGRGRRLAGDRLLGDLDLDQLAIDVV